MEACSSRDHYGPMPAPYSRTNAPQRGATLLVDGSNEKVQKEAYKINWKIAIPLLILGVIPGLIYSAGVAIANHLGGKEVRVQHPNPMEPNSYGKNTGFNQQDQHDVTTKDSYGQGIDRKRHQQTRTRERKVKSQEINRGQTPTPKQKEKPSRVDRVETGRPTSSQSAIPIQRSKRKTKAQSPQQEASRLIDTNMAWINKNIPTHLQDELGTSAVWISGGQKQPLGRCLDTVQLSGTHKPRIIREAQLSFLVKICTEEGGKYLKRIETTYPDHSIGSKRHNECNKKIIKFAEDTYEEIVNSLGDGIEQPFDHRDIRKQFEAIMNQKILDFNMKRLEKKIPDLFTNSSYSPDIITDWIPNHKVGKLGQFMTDVLLIPPVVSHIKEKLKKQAAESSRRAEESRNAQEMAQYIETLKKQSDRQVLGLPDNGKNLDRATIVKAYRKLALAHHPDKMSHNATLLERKKGEERFKRISGAHTNIMKAHGYS